MTWTRISDDWPDRPAMLEVSRSARLLLVELYVYANKHTTDGRVPDAAIRRCTDAENCAADLGELVTAGLVGKVPGESAWQLDWSEQEGAEAIRGRQAASARKQSAYRSRKAKHDKGDHSECHSAYCRQATAVPRNATGNATGLVTPPLPDPARPVPSQGDRGGGGALSADAVMALIECPQV